MKRAAKVLAGLVAVWFVLLFVLGFALAGRTARKVGDRLGESLQATATIEDARLGLIGGRFTFDKLVVRRSDALGTFALDVGTVDCDLAPLGFALVDRSCSELAVSNVQLAMSSVAMFKLQRPRRTPFRADRVVLDHADLAFSPSAFVPSLGQIHIKVEHAESGPTTFKSPLSFLFALEQLRAMLELPAGITVQLTYAHGTLVAAGSLFGATPVALPIALPVSDPTDDAQAEVRKLVAFGKALAEQLVAKKAEDWLRQRLPIGQ